MKNNTIYYDLTNDTAFRVVSTFADIAHTKQIKTNTGRAKMGERTETKQLSEIYERINAGELMLITDPKRICQTVETYRKYTTQQEIN